MARPIVEAFKKIISELIAETDWKALFAKLIASLMTPKENVFGADPQVAELRACLDEATDEDKAEMVEWLQAGAPAE